ncbi:MAG: T9SS type A sorting domain-containing protein [Bacteroidota bacterium]
MKNTTPIIFVFALLFVSSFLAAQPTFFLRMELANLTSTNLEVDVFMSGSAAYDLGSSNIQFAFDENAVENPTLDLTETTDLVNSTFYSKSLSTPGTGTGSLNIFLFIPNFGNVPVPAFPAETKLARIVFDIVDENAITDISWKYNGGSTQTVVFLDDESTQIFVNTPTSDLVGLTSQPLPVEMTGFETKPLQQEIALEWQTATEINFRGFDIQRSTNGIDFEPIGWMYALGGLSGSNYEFIDTDVRYNQIYYYRLKMVDEDESFEYSKIETAQISKEVLNGLSVFPNPTFGESTIELSTSEASNASLFIYDLQGKLVYNDNLQLDNGINQLRLNVNHLPPGNYEVIVQTQQEVLQQKLIKL